MCAFTQPNGTYCCQNPYLLQTILRSQWGFPGYVVSDCEAIYKIGAGTDLVCTAGGVSTSDALDTALWRTLTIRFRLGMFDPPEMVPYTTTPFSVVNSPVHDTIAAQAEREAIVLLKNQSNLLPLTNKSLKIACIGPHANQPEFYSGQLLLDRAVHSDHLSRNQKALSGSDVYAGVRCHQQRHQRFRRCRGCRQGR